MQITDEKKFWIAFSYVRGFGAVRILKLVEYFGSLQDAWNSQIGDLAQAGISKKNIENLINFRAKMNPDLLVENIIKSRIEVYFSDDNDYPQRLTEIEQKPPVLYYRGAITQSDVLSIGIVGTRKVSQYGKHVTSELAHFCADNGITTISGLARGVDAIGHSETIKSGGRTIAVLGSGVDVIYPPEHRHLAEKIIENGAIVSDYPPGTKPDRINFPPRNRIISGLSQAVVVVEAGERSGALITAEYAANQGREVFAVPGPITSPQSLGTNQLIGAGANILTEYKDLLDLLKINSDKMSQTKRVRLDPSELLVIQNLGSGSMPTDDLFNACGLPMEKFMAILTLLEIKGIVDQENGRVSLLITPEIQGKL